MDQKERMLANLPYKAWLDGLAEERLENKKKIFKYNNLEPGKLEEKDKLITRAMSSDIIRTVDDRKADEPQERAEEPEEVIPDPPVDYSKYHETINRLRRN